MKEEKVEHKRKHEKRNSILSEKRMKKKEIGKGERKFEGDRENSMIA